MNNTNVLLPLITSGMVMDSAFQWFKALRQKYFSELDLWQEPDNWYDLRSSIQQALLQSRYRFSHPQLVAYKNKTVSLWSMSDTLVLKAIHTVLSESFSAELGGLSCQYMDQEATRRMLETLVSPINDYSTAYKKAYIYVGYLDIEPASAKQAEQLCLLLQKRFSLEDEVNILLRSYLQQSGEFTQHHIAFDPLAPLMSAILLRELDQRMSQSKYFYARAIGEWLIVAPNHNQLRHALRHSQRSLKKAGLKGYDKARLVGELNWGFGFMDHFFNQSNLYQGGVHVDNRDARLLKFYNQGIDEHGIMRYLECWERWTQAGLEDCPGFDEQALKREWRGQSAWYDKIFSVLKVFIAPLLGLGLLATGMFLGDLLINTLDDSLHFASEFETFMNPRNW